MKAQEIMNEIPKGLLAWYTFKKQAKALYISNEKDGRYNLLNEKGLLVEQVSSNHSNNKLFIEKSKKKYDYIVAIQQIEKTLNPIELLYSWKKMLRKDGKLLLAVDNRLGLRYFCGDRDPFTGRSFDGIENYRQLTNIGQRYIKGRNYSKFEVAYFLKQAGWTYCKAYSVLPNLELPQLVYSENILPNEELGIRLFPKYNHPDSVFLEEKYIYTDLINNEMFHQMANSYLIECSINGEFDSADHVTISMDRGQENALMTIIRESKVVEKIPLYSEGYNKLIQMKTNADMLKNNGIKMVEGKLRNDSYIMPYINEPLAITYLRELVYMDLEKFIEEIDKYRDVVLQSSDHIDNNKELGIILKKGFLDLVPLNCFYIKGEYVFYDQEFFLDSYPANAIIFRGIEIIYMQDAKIESIIPKDFFWLRYGMDKQVESLQRMSGEFTYKLRHLEELKPYMEKCEADTQTIHTNRQRINYSKEEYQKIFGDIFKNIQNKKIILFGAGNFSKRFLSLYGKEYEIGFVVDNNPNQWGKQLEGHEIFGPEKLQKIDLDKYRIIICVKAFLPIVHQLKSLGIESYYVYDRNIEYGQNILPTQVVQPVDEKKQKKYNIGYIAGVFDLFHIGHLNLLKRAKEQCNYLIVGVVSDEGVKRNKKVEPYIPFEERIEIVDACSYVDKAVEIPLNFAGSREAYEKYKFDCQFSGSDYQDDPDWEANKMFLEKKGADLVFLSYTQQTSSTKIKKVIQQSLNKE